MRRTISIMLIAVGIGVLFWMLDAIWDYVFFVQDLREVIYHEPLSFTDSLILDVPRHEVWVRTAFMTACFVSGIVVSIYISRLHQLTDALKRREDDLASAQQLAGLGSWSWRPQTDRVIWSPQMYAIYHRDPRQGPWTIHEHNAHIHEEDRDRHIQAVKRAMDGEDHFALEFRIQLPDGELHHMQTVARVERDAQGQPQRVFGAVQDVTERRRDEERLAESERTWRTLLQNIQSGVAVHRADGVIVACNTALAKFFGTTCDEMRGRSAHDTDWGLLTEAGHPMPNESFPVIQVLETRKSVRNIILGIDSDYRDGVTWTLVNADPVFDSQGELSEVIATVTDITEPRRAAQQMRQQSELLQTVIDTIPVMILYFDSELNILQTNKEFERVTGYSKAEVTDDPVLTACFTDPEYRDEVRRFLLAHRGNWHDFTMQTKQRGQIESSWISMPLSGPRHLAIGLDITERRQAEDEHRALEAQIQHAQKLESLGVLAGGIAHDFNNLLVGILGNADLALTELSPVSPARESVQEIETAARRAAELCRQMLAYSGKGRFVVEPVDLSEVVEEMGHMLEVAISKKIVLKYNFSQNLPAVEADVTQIRQVVMNLITNASEAIGDRSGVVSISTGAMECSREYIDETYIAEDIAPGLYVTLEVADTGCGMTPETLAKLFDPFYTTKFTGRGLGLAAVLGIIRGHGGAIKVYSEPGRGSTFKVLLPASEASLPAASDARPETGAWRGKGTILLADDEETIRAVGSRMLERFGFDVITACDGADAVDVYRRHREEIVAVILDLTMPRLSGDEAFRELRQLQIDVPVVMSSGYNEQEVAERFLGKGIAGFIQKPYQLSSLETFLRGVLEKDNGEQEKD